MIGESMKRVLHILYNNMVKQGGIESFLIEMYRNIDRTKLQFDFLSLESSDTETYEEEIKQLGGEMYVLNIPRYKIFSVRKGVRDFLIQHPEYDTVQVHVSSLFYVEDLIGVKKAKVKRRIVHAHNSKQLGSKVLLIFHIINKMRIDKIVTDYFACSNLAAEFMYPPKIVNSHKYTVINNGINAQKFRFNDETRKIIRKELKIENEFVIGMVGRIAPQKNQVFLIDIFNEVLKINPMSKLVIVGDGPMMNDVIERIKHYNIEKKVILLGMRIDIEKLLCAFDIYVHPALFEGLGITIVEAQASGLPCVVSMDTIPDEAKIISNYRKIGLSETAEVWAKNICSIEKNINRQEYVDMVISAGYDSKDVAIKLQEFYLNN